MAVSHSSSRTESLPTWRRLAQEPRSDGTHAGAPAVVVLVHGAWHGAWCWSEVIAALESARVPVVAPDLASHGWDAALLTDLHADSATVRAAIDGAKGPVLLCGHSYGGAVITEAAAGHPAVRRLVYLAALMPDESETVAGLVGRSNPSFDRILRMSDDDTVRLDPVGARAMLYADCDPERAASAIARLAPQSRASLRQAPRGVAWRERPSNYVVCTRDAALLPSLQRSLAGRANQVIELAAGHSPFLCQPLRLARLLEDLAKDVGAPPN